MSEGASYDLLIAGGDGDPNVVRLLARASELGYSVCPCLYGRSGTPRLTVDVQRDRLLVNGLPVAPRAVFVRQDVFRYLETQNAADWQRAREWFQLVFGWVTARSDVRFLNGRYFANPRINKLAMLLLARGCGLCVPETYFTNDVPGIRDLPAHADWICKPVEGGEHTRELTEFLADVGERPAYGRPITVQHKLTGGEIRVFRIGDTLRSFAVRSDSLDYRVHQDAQVTPIETPAEIEGPYRALTDRLGLDFCAADFLTCPKTGKRHLLEVNKGPMFVHFDHVTHGQVTADLLARLCAA